MGAISWHANLTGQHSDDNYDMVTMETPRLPLQRSLSPSPSPAAPVPSSPRRRAPAKERAVKDVMSKPRNLPLQTQNLFCMLWEGIS